MSATVTEPSRVLEVTREYDTVVCGAGTAALFDDFTKADISLLQHRLKGSGVILHENELH